MNTLIRILAALIMLSAGLMIRSKHGSGMFRTGWFLIAVSCLGLLVIAQVRH